MSIKIVKFLGLAFLIFGLDVAGLAVPDVILQDKTIADISDEDLLIYGIWRIQRREDDLFIVASDGSLGIRLWFSSNGWFDFTEGGVEYTAWSVGEYSEWGSSIPIQEILAATPTGNLLEEDGSWGTWQFSFQPESMLIQNEFDIGHGKYGGLTLQKNAVSGRFQGRYTGFTLPLHPTQPVEQPLSCEPGRSGGAIILDPNKPKADQGIGATALTLDPKQQYCIKVSSEVTLLALLLQNQAEGDLNLYVRLNKPVEKSGEQILADFMLVSPSSTETIILAGSQLKSGSYFLAVENLQTTPQKFTILAIPVWNIEELRQRAAQGQMESPLLAFLSRYLLTDRGMLSLTQYKVAVAPGTKRLKIQLSGSADANLDMHIRFSKPVQVEGGQVVADLSLVGPTSNEGAVLTGKLLQAGNYYIAIEGPPGALHSFQLTVEADQEALALEPVE